MQKDRGFKELNYTAIMSHPKYGIILQIPFFPLTSFFTGGNPSFIYSPFIKGSSSIYAMYSLESQPISNFCSNFKVKVYSFLTSMLSIFKLAVSLPDERSF